MPARFLKQLCFVSSVAAIVWIVGSELTGSAVAADESGGAATAVDVYLDSVVPFAEKYCNRCHNDKEARGELNLTKFASAADVTRQFRRWSNIVRFIRDGQMPPEDAELQPTIDERNAVVRAVESILHEEAMKRAGDPGLVLPRRLSNTEYDSSVRDLTGIDIRPTKDFPADPAGGEGFDNTGEALGMSPSLLRKYLQAAQHVSHHLVLKPDGVAFAPFPVTSYNEQKKLTEQAIIDFYKRHDVRVRDYLEAAWRYQHRGEADRDVTLDAWAARRGLSGKYLSLVWSTLKESPAGSGYVLRIGRMWNDLPAPSNDRDVPAELAELDQFIEFCRRKLCSPEGQPIKSNAGNWPIEHLDYRARLAKTRDQFDPSVFQPKTLVRFDRLPKPNGDDGQTATLYLRFDPALEASRGNYVVVHRPLFSQSGDPPRNAEDEEKQQVVTLKSLLEQHAPQLAESLRFGRHPLGHEIDVESLVVEAPAVIEIRLSAEMLAQLDRRHMLAPCELDPQHGREGSVHVRRAVDRRPESSDAAGAELLMFADSEVAMQTTESAAKFCNVFPNRFVYVDESRGLAAGFHLVEGFFRDDLPLVNKVLDDKQVAELDRLWEELNFVTGSTENLIRGFVWFERSERHVLHDKRFDFLRSEDPKLVEDELLTRFERVYLDKMGVKLVEDSLKPERPSDRFDMIHGFFESIRVGLKRHKELLVQAESRGLRDLEQLAERAYHRPLEARDRESLRALYRALRGQGQSVEESMRGVLTAVLMSPDFCYRYSDTAPGDGIAPLSDNALASRLSYFLWSSLPDAELLDAARRGELQDEAELLKQTRRMIRDPRTAAFAREFFGQWLRYRDYLQNDSIIASTFPGYDDELREAMFEEPTRLALYLLQEDLPITELLKSDVTFVNRRLAEHYGGEILEQHRRAANEEGGSSASGDDWRRVDGLRESGRGGFFGMGVVLTTNSAGERTSPVKRGFWTVHHLLGQHFPPPPADVPELPKNEKDSGGTIRDLLAAHTANPRCAMCHVHFDGLGLAMEGFDPVGRSRTKDLAGRTIDDVASFPNGGTAKGISGLIDYIDQHRRDDFVRTFCRKFLGYALGRSVMLSDQPLLDEMETALERDGYRFSALFETVVRSPQFRKQRGSDHVAGGP